MTRLAPLHATQPTGSPYQNRQVNNQAINAALCAKSPDERKAITDKYGIAKEEVLKFWNGGKICGQCKHYSPLGGVTALNGTCEKVVKKGYTKPSDVACNKMERSERLLRKH